MMDKLKITRFKKIIEDTNWDEQTGESERFLDYMSYIAIILAVCYFGPVVIGIINR